MEGTMSAEDVIRFSIVHETLPEAERLVVSGELDMANCSELALQLETLRDPVRPVIVDLSELAFTDSAGIHTLLREAERQTRMVLVCPPGNVRRVLRITSVETTFACYPTLDEAIADIRRTRPAA
jgi:anti-anti-sigma factor